MEFINLVEEHYHGVREDMSGKVDFVIVNPPYDMKRVEIMILRSMIFFQSICGMWARFLEGLRSLEHIRACSATLCNLLFGTTLLFREKERQYEVSFQREWV